MAYLNEPTPSVALNKVGAAQAPIDTSLITPDMVSSVIAWYDAADPGNTTHNWTATLTPSDIDTVNHKVLNTGFNFSITRPAAGASVVTGDFTPVYWEALPGGTLPGGVTEGTPYFAVDNAAGGIDLYPYATSAHLASFPGTSINESVAIADNALYNVNKITFSSAGSGSFRLYCNPTISRLVDKKGLASCDLTSSATVIGDQFELITDSKGTFLRVPGGISKNYYQANHSIHGKLMNFGGNNLDTKALYAGKRIFYQLLVGRAPYIDLNYAPRKVPGLSSASLNTGTGVFTKFNHGLATGDFIKGSANGPGTNALPTPNAPNGAAFTAGCYVRRIASSTFSLHPTSGDASSNTNVITYSANITGNVSLLATQRCQDQRQHRYISLDTALPNSFNSHFCIVALNGGQQTGFQGIVQQTASFINLANGTFSSVTHPALKRVYVYIPPDGVGPTCVDTMAPLTAGWYWTSRSNGDTFNPGTWRIHRTEASAIAGNGLSDALCGGIKFLSYGTGEMLIQRQNEDIHWASLSGGTDRMDGYFPTIGVPVVYCVLWDGNNPSESFTILRYNENGVWKSKVVTSTVKGNLGAATSDTNPWILGNSAQGHVPGEFDVYEMVVGSSSSDADADIASLMSYFTNKYGIS